MNGAEIHLALNHFPLIGLIFGFLLILSGMVRRSSDVARAGVATLVLTAVVAIVVYVTGEPAEEIVEHLPGISEDFIERHEEAGLVSLFGLEVLGVLSLLGLVAFRRPRPMPGWFLPALLVLAALASSWVGWTSHLGGQISHPETRAEFTAPAAADESH